MNAGLFFRGSIREFRTPHISTWIAGLAVGIPAGFFDIATFADLANIGTLFAFVLVSIGQVDLTKKSTEPTAFVPCPILTAYANPLGSCCALLMLSLPLLAWVCFFSAGWWVCGLPRAAGREACCTRRKHRRTVIVLCSRQAG